MRDDLAKGDNKEQLSAASGRQHAHCYPPSTAIGPPEVLCATAAAWTPLATPGHLARPRGSRARARKRGAAQGHPAAVAFHSVFSGYAGLINELLEEVSEPLRRELHFEIYADLLSNHPLLAQLREQDPSGGTVELPSST